MSYRVEYLSDFEFDNLPYKHVREAVGCADPKTDTAYVRKSGVPVVDMFVTQHEIEELIATVSPHEEDGIRYKKGGAARSIVPTVVGSLLSLINPALGIGVGAAMGGGMNAYAAKKHPEQLGSPLMSGLTGAVQGGLGSWGGGGILNAGKAGFQAAAPGFMSKAGGVASGIGKMFGLGSSTTGANTATNAASSANAPFSIVGKASAADVARAGSNINWGNIGSNIGSVGLGVGSNMGQMGMPAASGMGLAPSAANTYNAIGGSTAGTNQALMSSFGVPSAAPITGGAAMGSSAGIGNTGINTAGTTAKTGLWDKLFPKEGGYSWGKTILGGAVPLIGQAFGPQATQFNPEQSQLFNDVLSRVKQGNMVQLTPEQRTAISATYDRELEDARGEILARWRAARPGSDITNDTELQKAFTDLESQYASEKANALVAAQMGLTQQQTEMLSQLASLDIYSLAQAAQISTEEANQFKQMLSDMGMMVSQSGGNSPYAGIGQIFGGK